MKHRVAWTFVGALALTVPLRVAESSSPPICDPGGPYAEWEGCPIEFDGSGSQAPGGEIVSYVWDFGDGTTGEGVRPSHIYRLISWNRVVLTVTDDFGKASACSTFASVDSDNILAPLECDAGGPYASAVGDSIRFDASANVDRLPAYQWDFGDGTTGIGPSPTHAYAVADSYNVTLNVSDFVALACHLFEREGSCETTVLVGLEPVKSTTWGSLKALYR